MTAEESERRFRQIWNQATWNAVLTVLMIEAALYCAFFV